MNKARYIGHPIDEPESLGSVTGAFSIVMALIAAIGIICLILQ